MGEIVKLARYRVHFVINHDNLVQDPSNDKSILATDNVNSDSGNLKSNLFLWASRVEAAST